MEQYVLNLIGISVSVAVIMIMLKLCSRWLDENLRLKWKKYLYLFLAIRLLIPVNIGIPVLSGTRSAEEMKIGVSQTNHVPSGGTAAAGNKVPAHDSLTSDGTRPVSLYTPIRIWIDRTQKYSPFEWCFYIWLAGFAFGLMRLVIEFACYRRRLLRGAKAEDDTRVLEWVAQISEDLHISRSFQIMQTPEKVSPMVLGVAKPILILPKTQRRDEELYYILKHELIHLKRNDILYKYILLLAKTVHWFNPFAHLLVRDAGINLELYCDERVIVDGNFGEKKQYVEAIIGALEYGSGNAKFSTEFYGERETMKKRFQNILKENHRKRGAGMVSLILAATVLCGMLMACTAQTRPEEGAKNPPEDVSADGMNQTKADVPALPDSGDTTDGFSDEELDLLNPSAEPAEKDPQEEPELSDAAKEVQKIAETFTAAYFNGDITTIKTYLTNPYAWSIDAYEGTEEVTVETIKGLGDIPDDTIGGVFTISTEFKNPEYPDSYQYLTMEFVREADGWKIQFYGIEG